MIKAILAAAVLAVLMSIGAAQDESPRAPTRGEIQISGVLDVKPV
jgi:hypothetical protein